MAWVCPQLKTLFFDQRDYICFEKDEISSIYFLKRGSCGFVLPEFSNIKYIDIDLGATFGIIDIVGNAIMN
jgi:hypothetical protein